jgi:hypothetical protein
MAIYYPPIFINKYLQQKLGAKYGALPMYPTFPTDFSITDGFSIDDLIGGGKFFFDGKVAIYDRMLKMRRSPFPHTKSEQLLYYFYAINEAAVEGLIELTQEIQDFLDREDESAQEVNDWISSLPGAASGTVSFDGKEFLLPFFHRIRIYQLEETRDIVDFGTARTFAGNKIIIDYDWHKSE